MPVSESPSGEKYDSFTTVTTDEAASTFWSQKLRDMGDATVFPIELTSTSAQSRGRETTSYIFSGFPLPENGYSLSSVPNLVHAAWAVLVAQENNANSVVFAISATDLHPMPKFVRMTGDLPVGKFLHEVQQDTIKSSGSNFLELENIREWSKIGFPQLNTHIMVNASSEDAGKRTLHPSTEIPWDRYESSFPLLLRVSINHFRIHMTAEYDVQFIENSKMSRLLEQLDFIIGQLDRHSTQSTELRHVNFCNPKDFAKILTWNSTNHDPVEDCIHWEFSKQASLQPEAEAISAWDRNFTYQELDDVTARLAAHLQSLPQPVGPGVTVPICFPKSAYVIVAMLAVLRAGGAYTPIDPAHPQSRILEIIGQLGATTVLTSPENLHLFNGTIVGQVLEVSGSAVTALAKDTSSVISTTQPPVKPSDPCMILFTSGSTGKPKGIILEHKSLCKVFREHGKASGFQKGMRTFQFSAHTYDVCHSEIFETLYWGGTVCVPSEEDRMSNIAGFINRHNVDWAFLTPSVAGLLDPTQTPSLKTLSLGGEAVPGEVLRLWKSHVRVVITYGPSECSIYTSVKDLESDADIGTLGKGRGCTLWVVDPQNHDILMPIGAIGELVIEGPIVAREYLNNAELSKNVFIQNPQWQFERHSKSRSHSRYCKTGDLVRYDPNGAIRFVGRKDTMIKLRGQRLELGDVEFHLKLAFPKAKVVYPMIITPQALGKAKHLAAFILMDRMELETSTGHATKDIDTEGIFTSLLSSQEWHNMVQEAQDLLSESLPRHMIPTMFIPMRQLPFNASMKTDQKRLHELGASLTLEQLKFLNAATSSKSSTNQRPMSKEEKTLHSLWALALDRDARLISLEDNFFRIGGDSVLAMRLVRLARDAGYAITYKDVFQISCLADLSKVMVNLSQEEATQHTVQPFSLLKQNTNQDEVLQQAAQQLNIQPSMIEDILPCTPLQEGLITSTVRLPGSYVTRSVFHIQPHVDVERLQSACEMLVSLSPSLRTRIVDLPHHGFLQVIVDEPLQWQKHDAADEDASGLRHSSIGLNSPLAFFELVRGSPDSGACLIWTFHHAVYDGHSISLILESLESLYDKGAISFSPTPFPLFLEHIKKERDQDGAVQFWKSQFSGDFNAPLFLGLPLPDKVPLAGSSKKHYISGLVWPNADVTPATIVRTAWAILQSQYTGSQDVLFERP